jgi:hypothetical protein
MTFIGFRALAVAKPYEFIDFCTLTSLLPGAGVVGFEPLTSILPGAGVSQRDPYWRLLGLIRALLAPTGPLSGPYWPRKLTLQTNCKAISWEFEIRSSPIKAYQKTVLKRH